MAKTKGELAKKVLKKLLVAGAYVIAAQSPFFWLNFYNNLFFGDLLPGDKRKIGDTFYNLKRRGLIKLEKKNKQIYMSLTKEGMWQAGKYQTYDLEIKKPEKWDRKWRLIIFDIPEGFRIKRDIFRRKLKEVGFYQFQKSVWVYPFPCDKEINLLRDFFGLTKRNLVALTVEEIEDEDDLKKFFDI